MHNNIITYVKEYGRKSFEKMPFNEVDSLLLCQLSYLDYGSFVKGLSSSGGSVPVSSIYYDKDKDRIFDGYWYRDENIELFKEVSLSARFGGMKLDYFENVNDEESDTQFAAITYILSPDTAYIAYRGTDASLIGWKEDLKLAYSKPLNSQELAADYLNKVAELFKGKLYVGGHSKGGNLAVYAAMKSAPSVKDRLISIFDNDGPGFRPEILETLNYDGIKGKIKKFIPRSSVVGVILEADEDYDIVDCWSVGTLQHNTYTWKSEDGAFLRAKEMKTRKKVADRALNEWILSLSEDEISTFIDTLYSTITATDAKNIFDIKEDLRGNLKESIAFAKELDDDTKKALQKIFKSFIDIYDERASEEYAKMQKSFKNELQALYSGAAELFGRKKAQT